MTAYERVQDALGGGEGPMFQCPSHEDKNASLSVSEGSDGRVLVFCFAGCDTRAVVEALGLKMADLFPNAGDRGVPAAEYVYTDEKGDPLIRVTRFSPKGFAQHRWDASSQSWRTGLGDVRRVPYHLPRLLTHRIVWVVEGEKDVEVLLRILPAGQTATTLLGGAGKWRDDYAEFFRDRDVRIIADNDKAGLEGAARVRAGMRGATPHAQAWKPPNGFKDVSDMLDAGLGLGDLLPVSFASERSFSPMDWRQYRPEQVEWLLEPYVPAGQRVLAYGAAGSLKSLWAMWVACQLAKEGHRVAYFSLEMQPKEVAKRLQKMDPPTDRFKLFRRIDFESKADLEAACDLLRGFSLIVVDSWSSVQGDTNSNDVVARTDREFFLPLTEETGAALLVLDNTGQTVITDRGKVRPDWARGASAKHDKMDVALHFERPEEGDNHLVRIKVKKMRLDRKIPKPLLLRVGPGEIDFRVTDDNGADLGSMWTKAPDPPQEENSDAPESILDKLRRARQAARLKVEL